MGFNDIVVSLPIKEDGDIVIKTHLIIKCYENLWFVYYSYNTYLPISPTLFLLMVYFVVNYLKLYHISFNIIFA